MKKLAVLGLAFLFSACAITPEQQAKRAEMQRREAQNLQIFLAEQCNPATASLMRQYFAQGVNLEEASQRDFKLRYVEQVNDPMFQACYRLAWQNYVAQEQIQMMRHYERRYWPYYSPWFW